MLQASHGDEISPLHFAIENHDGRLIVRDLASHLGTLVADRRIGHGRLGRVHQDHPKIDRRRGPVGAQAGVPGLGRVG